LESPEIEVRPIIGPDRTKKLLAAVATRKLRRGADSVSAVLPARRASHIDPAIDLPQD